MLTYIFLKNLKKSPQVGDIWCHLAAQYE